MNKKLFTAKRLRQILNDLKRRPEDAAKELKISKRKIDSILKGKTELNLDIINRIIKKWPVNINYFINSNYLSNEDPKITICKKKYSKSTSRIIKRKNKDYYEYQDTAMARNAPFRPEWIRTLCLVDNNNPNNKSVIWNKGHLLHQFTYFVGKVNFYYKDKKGKKRVSLMNTGDSMYISPYVPHSFASRDKGLNFIIALTYQDKITNEIQENLTKVGKKNIDKIILNFDNFYKSSKSILNQKLANSFISQKEFLRRTRSLKHEPRNKNLLENLLKYSNLFNLNLRDILSLNTNKKVEIIKKNSINSWYYPSEKSKKYVIKELATSKFVPEAKSFEIEVLKNNNLINHTYSHQYAYVLDGKLKLKIDKKVYNLSKDDTFYIKPFTKFILSNSRAKILILRIPVTITGDNLFQISQVGKKNIDRVISENQRWY